MAGAETASDSVTNPPPPGARTDSTAAPRGPRSVTAAPARSHPRLHAAWTRTRTRWPAGTRRGNQLSAVRVIRCPLPSDSPGSAVSATLGGVDPGETPEDERPPEPVLAESAPPTPRPRKAPGSPRPSYRGPARPCWCAHQRRCRGRTVSPTPRRRADTGSCRAAGACQNRCRPPRSPRRRCSARPCSGGRRGASGATGACCRCSPRAPRSCQPCRSSRRDRRTGARPTTPRAPHRRHRRPPRSARRRSASPGPRSTASPRRSTRSP